MQTYTENVILITEEGKTIGFISRSVVYGCEKLNSEQIARLIDPGFGVISREVKRAGEEKAP